LNKGLWDSGADEINSCLTPCCLPIMAALIPRHMATTQERCRNCGPRRPPKSGKHGLMPTAPIDGQTSVSVRQSCAVQALDRRASHWKNGRSLISRGWPEHQRRFR